MATTTRDDEAMVQLATRVPRRLLRELKLHGVRTETTMQAMVVAALREHLRRAPA
jgi:hypothetical protein